MHRQQITHTYDRWAATYDSFPNPLIAIEQVAVWSLLRWIPCETLLDAATGTGRHALHLARQGKRVTAVDGNQAMLEIARQKAKNEGLSIDFRQEELNALSFADGSFDLVLCALALSHNPDPTEPCAELARMVRPGGVVLISDLHPFMQEVMGGAASEIELADGQAHPFPLFHREVSAYEEAVTAAGLKIEAVLDVPSLRQKPDGEFVADLGGLIVWARRPAGA